MTHRKIYGHRSDRCFLRRAVSLPLLGTSFIPEMQEGTLSPNADRVPNISLEELSRWKEMQRLMRQVPGVDNVVSRLGRGDHLPIQLVPMRPTCSPRLLLMTNGRMA